MHFCRPPSGVRRVGEAAPGVLRLLQADPQLNRLMANVLHTTTELSRAYGPQDGTHGREYGFEVLHGRHKINEPSMLLHHVCHLGDHTCLYL